MYLLNKIVWWLVNPYQAGLVSVAIGFGLIIVGRRGVTLGKWLMAFGIGWLYIWSSGMLFIGADDELAKTYPPKMAEEYPAADAIADLGGGMGINTNIHFYAEINPGADRVWFSAELWKAGKAQIVIPSAKYTAIADEQLLLALGVPKSAIVLESEALNTEQNAKFVQEVVKSVSNKDGRTSACNKPKVLVVTSVWHMRRAMLMFERYAPDIEAIPAPTDYGRVGGVAEEWWVRLLPSMDHFCYNSMMFHEWLGYWGYRLFRR